MATPEEKLNSLKEHARTLNERDSFVKKADIVRLFDGLKSVVKALGPSIKKTLSKEFTALFRESNSAIEKVRADAERIVADAKAERIADVKAYFKDFESRVSRLSTTITEATNGLLSEEDVRSMIRAGVAEAIRRAGDDFNSENIRNHLELLTGDERLDREAIRGIDELESELRKLIQEVKDMRGFIPAGSGLRGVEIYVDGEMSGLTTYLNFIPGNGVTLGVNRVGERTDITFSAEGGGGSFTVLPATGVIDDSNTTFTFPSEPKVVVVNGQSYIDGDKVEITGTTAELDYPVGEGGSIYGLG